MAETAESSHEVEPHRPNAWTLWVDTGGTFTDCVAIDARGRTHRAKVLSSSTIRGRSEWRESRNILGVTEEWALPQDFFTGAAVRPLGSSELPPAEIRHYDSVRKHFVLATEVGDEWRRSPPFEISAPVEAPVLAAHWVTGTPLNQSLPPIAMRLATTRGTNALLERKGTPPVLFVTEGFGDLLEIGNQ
ncbi:MAG: hydantoinase/oxoprolinase N-terminal domain-containing protein, partial [Acidobacteriota bacterium]